MAPAPGNAAASTSRLVLSSDNVFGGDVDLGTVAIPALAAATQVSATRTVQIPGNTVGRPLLGLRAGQRARAR